MLVLLLTYRNIMKEYTEEEYQKDKDEYYQSLIEELKNGWMVWSISDWYHTFDELYEHRTALFSRLCNYIPSHKSRKHSDWTMFEWMFIVIWYVGWKQISYHCENKTRDSFLCEEREFADERNWHTPQDVVNILYWRI